MGRATQRRGRAGLTLVELLVVMGIIGVISAVVVPISIRNGWFTGGKSAFAARELFTILKAARVYASTYNVETAVAYGGVLVEDSELKGITPPVNFTVPVADTIVLARRLKREEMVLINQAAPGTFPNVKVTDIFVPLSSADGVLRVLPKQMVVLPDLFEVQGTSPNFVSSRGLEPIRIYSVTNGAFLPPRSDYALTGAQPSSFPAHRFLPDGSLRIPGTVSTQRFTIRVGARPDAVYRDRFHTNSATDRLFPETRRLVYNADNATSPIEMVLGLDGNPATNDYPDIAASIEIFATTGRMRLVP